MLVVGMAGAKLGDRFVQIGCAHGGRLAAIARQVGLSGRAVVVTPDDATSNRVQKAATQAGVLVEVIVAPPTRLPLHDDTFDLAIFDDTAQLVTHMPEDVRATAIQEARRILRPGGRVMVIGSTPRRDLAAFFSSKPKAVSYDPTPSLAAGGFSSPRTLAQRDGLIFIEALNPRSPA